MPQGGIELNESPKDAVFREAMEEIGTNNFNIMFVNISLFGNHHKL